MKRLTILLFFSLLCSSTLFGEAPFVYDPPRGEGRYILTPPPPSEPVIGGAPVFGVRPEHPFRFQIPATGERPMRFSVKELPAGLSVDTATGLIEGVIADPGPKTYEVVFRAENRHGAAERPFRIVVGETLSLTPAMGWSSWNAYYEEVDHEKVLACARGMVERGLIHYGWTYVNIDDAWQARRGGPYNAIQPNEKFPDMKGLVEEIHAMGLKVGIYSSPWKMTFAGFIGGSADTAEGAWPFEDIQFGTSWRDRAPHQKVAEFTFDEQDVKQWVDWGIDYLKYDWKGHSDEHMGRMYKALRESGRDIVFSISPRADGKLETYYAYANSWRISVDIRNSWDSVLVSWDWINRWKGTARPGHYPDADMMIVDGCWGGESNLTPDEQYTHVSLWALWSSPMILGSHLPAMTDFSISLLSNHEIIAVHQDPLCVMAEQFETGPGRFVFRKPLENGDLAVGLVNRGENQVVVTAPWETLGLEGPQAVRDLWRQEDLGVFDDAFAAVVPRHGTVMLRLRPAGAESAKPRPGLGVTRPVAAPVMRLKPQSSPGDPVRIELSAPEGDIHYQLDGREPTVDSPVVKGELKVEHFARFQAVAIRDGVASEPVKAEISYCPAPPARPDAALQNLTHRERFGTWTYEIKPGYKRFVARVKVSEDRDGPVVFRVQDRGHLLARSPELAPGAEWAFDLPLSGSSELAINPTPDGERSGFHEWTEAGFLTK